MRGIRALIGLLFALAALVSLSPAASAEDNGATKVDLQQHAFGSCSSGPGGGAPAGGFAIIHSTGAGDVIAVLSLKNMTPNHTYDVALVQTPSGTDCFAQEFQVTTNSSGNGTVNMQEALRPDTTGVFVLVQPSTVEGYIHSTSLVAVG